MSDKASILIVDDEENLRRTLAMILQREGYVVKTAASIKEARQCLEVDPYDLTFLDLKLPDESGLTLLPELRSNYPQMPVLILTAQDKLDAALEAVRKGARDYLLKPLDPPLIIKRAREVLAEREQSPAVSGKYTRPKGLLNEMDPNTEPKAPPPDKPAA
jgi:DNA-binding NtrC family response regulator